MNMNKVIIKNKEHINPAHQNEYAPYEYFKYIVSGAEDKNLCNVSIYEIPPGKSNYPYHYHTANEEIFYIISGKGLLRTPEGERTVSPGDVALFPPSDKGAHKLTNISETETLVYLDVDTNRFPEVVFYPDSDKIGIKAGGEMKNLFMYDTDVDYYAGE
jgi:uncharacterized cupin superfamily protein